LMYDRAPREYAEQDRHLWEPFLHKITIGVLRFETYERLGFYRPSRTQRFRETGPPPTCPFI